MYSWLSRLHFSLPSLCLGCRAWATGPVCASCAARCQEPPARCLRCALPLPLAANGAGSVCGACLITSPPLQQCLCAVTYAFPWQDCVVSYKFHGAVGLGRHLARKIFETPGMATALAQQDVLVPLPLAPERLAERGFNQSLELARPLARWARRPLDSTSLVRLRDTAPQRTLSRTARLANMRGAFAVLPERLPQVRGRRIGLVDDVMTSGASLHAAAQALLQAGACCVTGLVYARTSEHP